jgi:hypothetical protein
MRRMQNDFSILRQSWRRLLSYLHERLFDQIRGRRNEVRHVYCDKLRNRRDALWGSLRQCRKRGPVYPVTTNAR